MIQYSLRRSLTRTPPPPPFTRNVSPWTREKTAAIRSFKFYLLCVARSKNSYAFLCTPVPPNGVSHSQLRLGHFRGLIIRLATYKGLRTSLGCRFTCRTAINPSDATLKPIFCRPTVWHHGWKTDNLAKHYCETNS